MGIKRTGWASSWRSARLDPELLSFRSSMACCAIFEMAAYFLLGRCQSLSPEPFNIQKCAIPRFHPCKLEHPQPYGVPNLAESWPNGNKKRGWFTEKRVKLALQKMKIHFLSNKPPVFRWRDRRASKIESFEYPQPYGKPNRTFFVVHHLFRDGATVKSCCQCHFYLQFY